jgi:uncharacterized membrane protein YhaH (DUF805 family)
MRQKATGERAAWAAIVARRWHDEGKARAATAAIAGQRLEARWPQ